MQGLGGPDLQFFDVFVGVPGSVHDSRLLRLSKFGGDMLAEHILPGTNTYFGRDGSQTNYFGGLCISPNSMAYPSLQKVAKHVSRK